MFARIICVAVLALVSGTLNAAEAVPSGMEKFQPGKEHEALAKLAGKYEIAQKCWMEPGKPPVEVKGTAEFTPVLNGRQVKQEFKSELMGKPYNGLGLLGFDRVAEKYTAIWADDFSTGAMLMTGTSPDGGKTITFTSDGICPMDGSKLTFRAVHTQVSADKFTFEMFATHAGKEDKSMEITYTRVK